MSSDRSDTPAPTDLERRPVPGAIRHLDRDAMAHAYNVDLQMLYPWDGVVEPPFGAAWAVLAPGESTKPHAHQELETFFVAQGRGAFSIGDERVEVGPGSVTFHEPFHNHTLTNLSQDEDLLFLTVWWEDKGRWEGHGDHQGDGHDHGHGHDHDHDHDHGAHPASAPAPEASAAAEAAPAVRRTLVTAAPPTPNGDLHLGHLAGPYLSADYHTRFLRLTGVDAHFACGTDDNSIFVQSMGETMDLGPQEAADHFAERITETLEAAGVDLSAFPRPNESSHHHRLVQEMFRTLWDKGELVAKETPGLFSPSTGGYVFEAYVQGTSPHTGEIVVGHTCEDTGRVYDPTALLDPTIPQTGETPVVRPVERVVFPLSRWEDRLRDYYRRVEMGSHLRSLCETLLDEGLEDFVVTHPTDWGIPVPVDGFEDQRIHVWFEMAARYLAYARHVGEAQGLEGDEASWERFWKSEEARVVQFFGFDNSFYYAMLIPALFMAFDEDLRLPAAFVTNEFYRLDGAKFSTSRDHRILGRDLLAEGPRDPVRFYLAHTCPEREETNFTLEDFRAVLRRELLEGWSGWIEDLFGRLADHWDGAVPATGDWTGEHRRFYARLRSLAAEVEHAWSAEAFSPQRATRALAEIVREARRFGRGEIHWRGVPTHGEEGRTGIALEALAARLLGLAAAPVMPEFAERLWRALGEESGPGDGDWSSALEWLPAGRPVPGLDGPVFPALAAALEG